jgi:hypothetical protein
VAGCPVSAVSAVLCATTADTADAAMTITIATDTLSTDGIIVEVNVGLNC